MIQTDSEKAREQSEEKNPAASSADPRPTVATSSEKLAEEAEAFCADLERFFRRAFGEIPKASELGELRGQQASVRDMVRRALALGSGDAEELAALSGERDKYKDAAARARADFLNYQSRSAKDLERAEELALRGFVSDLLPVLDSVDLAQHDAAQEKSDPSHIKEALGMIAMALTQVLKVRGLERIQSAGKDFDPKVHEAVAKRPADPAKGEKPNTVLEEFRPSYLWKGLLLRPAQVLVAETEK